jgi:hypothetical protein
LWLCPSISFEEQNTGYDDVTGQPLVAEFNENNVVTMFTILVNSQALTDRFNGQHFELLRHVVTYLYHIL